MFAGTRSRGAANSFLWVSEWGVVQATDLARSEDPSQVQAMHVKRRSQYMILVAKSLLSDRQTRREAQRKPLTTSIYALC